MDGTFSSARGRSPAAENGCQLLPAATSQLPPHRSASLRPPTVAPVSTPPFAAAAELGRAMYALHTVSSLLGRTGCSSVYESSEMAYVLTEAVQCHQAITQLWHGGFSGPSSQPVPPASASAAPDGECGSDAMRKAVLDAFAAAKADPLFAFTLTVPFTSSVQPAGPDKNGG